MTDKKLLANFTSLLFSNFSVQALRFFTIIIITRKLGPELFGVYNYILLLVSLCAILVEFGLKSYAIREFSLNRGSWNIILKIFLTRSVMAIVSAVIVGLLTYQAFRSVNLVAIALLFSTSLFIDAFLIDFVAIAQEKLHLQAIAQLFQAAFYLLVVYLILNRFTNLNWIALAFSASHFLLILPYFLGINSVSKGSVEPAKLKKIVSGGFPFLIATVFSSFQSQMDIFLLGQFHFNHLLGDYSACLKLLSIPLGVVNSLLSSVQPKIAQNIEKKSELIGILKKYFKPLLIFIFFMNFIFFAFGREIIYLFFGEKFFSSILYIKPLTLVTSVFILTLLPMHALFVSHRTHKLLSITFFNFLLSFIAISTVLYFRMPFYLPWAMLFVQCVCCYQAWRVFLKK